jgi:hypothetical protein
LRAGLFPARPYLAIYTVETDDLAQTMTELIERVGTDAMVISPTIDRENSFSAPFVPLGPPMSAA